MGTNFDPGDVENETWKCNISPHGSQHEHTILPQKKSSIKILTIYQLFQFLKLAHQNRLSTYNSLPCAISC